MRRFARSERPLLLGTGLAILIGTATILSLATDVGRQVEELATANTQASQWSMAQSDVEFLSFILATYADTPEGTPDLRAIRQRHDIFFGRVKMLETRYPGRPLDLVPEYAAGLGHLSSYIERVTPLMDGPDDLLSAALPQIRAEAEKLRPALRYVTLSSQRQLAHESDARRELARDTLQQIGLLIFLLITALVALVVSMGLLLRRVRRNATREALTHARLRAIILSSIDGILVVDEAGLITEANAAAEFQFGPRPDGLIGLRANELITSIGRDGLLRRGLPPPGPRYSRILTQHIDGSRNPAECSVAETSGEDGRIRICFLHDISDRLAAEAALTQARDRAVAGEKSKADMLAVMSHEMRTPLNGILGTLDLVWDTRLTALQREYMRIIRISGNQLLRHVNDVLDISRLDAGKMTVAQAPFEITSLLSDLAESQRALAEAQGNRVVINAQMVGGWVTGDQQKLGQVLLNLLGNAAKFTRDGTIVLSASRQEGEDRVTFRVSDTGIGIAPGDLQRIFEDFVTLDASYRRSSEGTGLGLPISRRLVQAMGGELEIESRLGQGSSFSFSLRLPATAPAERMPRPGQPQTAKPDPAQLWRPLDVLVVEDSPINRFVLRAMLEGDGHDVTEAQNGVEGVKCASERRYDLIFMDIAMPEMDGTQATRLIRASGGPSADVPIIALTAHALPADLDRFAAAGVSSSLTKPLTRPQLRETIRNLQGNDPAPDPAALSEPPTAQPPQATPDPQEGGDTPEAAAPGGAAQTPAGLLDAEQTANLRSGLGETIFARLVERYIDETATEIARLQAGWSVAPAQDLAAIAHLLAGSAAIFGAKALRLELIALETALREMEDDDATALLASIGALWPETRAALAALT